MNTATANSTVELALGRIFRLASRTTQQGDIADYERCRAIILDELLSPGVAVQTGYQPNYCAQRNSGAAGDY